MQLKRLVPLALVAAASAQSLLDALAAQNATLSTLSGVLSSLPAVVSALGAATNITLLAPNNAALTKFLGSPLGGAAATMPDLVTAILDYHVLQGDYPASSFSATPKFIHTLLSNTSYTNVTGGQVVEAVVNGTNVEIISGYGQISMVTQADIKFNGGVIHVIDTVLTIPGTPSNTASAGGLTTLISVANSAGLTPVLDGTKDVTIFAPTNAAFAAISNVTSTLNATQLAGILAYHVVAGTVGYSSILTNTSLTTLAGTKVNITVTSAGVMVNSAHVIVADVLVSNGVAHVIDAVLIPPTAAAAGAGNATTTGGANSTASSTAKTSGSASPSAGAASQVQGGALGAMALLGAALINNF